MAKDVSALNLARLRPFEEAPPWKLVTTDQTRPFRPNRVFADQSAGRIVLAAMKSRSGDDYAVSADALNFFPSRIADPASWVKQVFIQLVIGEWDKPDKIVVTEVIPLADAQERIRGATPLHGRGEFGAYFWVRPLGDDKPM
jgi:hypothetical protein